MDAIDYIQSRVNDQAVTCDVLSDTESASYSDDVTQVGTVEIAVYAPSSAAEMVPAGIEESTSFTGLVVPQRDGNGDLVNDTAVGDTLRVQSNTAIQYEVMTRDGVPNELDPHLWVLGLDRANG